MVEAFALMMTSEILVYLSLLYCLIAILRLVDIWTWCQNSEFRSNVIRYPLLWAVTLISAPSTTQAFNVPAFNACIQVLITYVHLSFLPVFSATCGHSTAATVSQCWTSTRPPEWCASLGQGDTGSRWGPHQLNLLWQSPGELMHSSVSNVLSSTGSISLYITEPP